MTTTTHCAACGLNVTTKNFKRHLEGGTHKAATLAAKSAARHAAPAPTATPRAATRASTPAEMAEEAQAEKLGNARGKRLAKAASAAPTAPRAAELPPVGTRLEHRDRHGALVAACEIVAGDLPVVMEGKGYSSLTAATRAIGQKGSGPKFWGLVAGPARGTRGPSAPSITGLGKAWDGYLRRLEAATITAGDTLEHVAAVRAAARTQLAALTQFVAGLDITFGGLQAAPVPATPAGAPA